MADSTLPPLPPGFQLETDGAQFGAGNIDLTKRPKVRNPDGSVSTVRSISANFDGQEVLIPTVSDDGRIMSDDEAIQNYRTTGKHLGKFATPEEATAYAETLHNDQAAMYAPPPLPPGFEIEEPGLEIDIVGGTRGAAPTAEEMAALRHPDGRLTEEGWQKEIDAQKAKDPLADDGWYSRYLAGVGLSGMRTLRGVPQAIYDNSMKAVDAIEPLFAKINPEAAKGAADMLRAPQAAMRKNEAEAREYEAPIRNNLAGFFGDAVGTVGQLFLPGAVLRGTALGRLAMPTSLGGNALQGMALGGIQPVAEEGERSTNTLVGGLGGAGGAALAKVVGAGARVGSRTLSALLGRPTASGSERAAGRVIADEAGDMRNLLVPQPSAVPGVQRTFAEEVLNPGVARLERQVRGQTNVFDPIDRANNAARVTQLEGIAGTDADYVAAEAARGTAASGARQQAMAAGPVSIADTMTKIDAAIDSLEGRPAIQGALEQLKGLLTKDVKTGAVEDRIHVLDNVRMTIGDMLDGKFGADNARALAGSRELLALRDSLNGEVTAQVPAFGQYLDAYRQGSLPINRMDIGRDLLSPGSGGSVLDPITGTQVLTPAQFSKKARDLDAVAARATGFDKARADQILTAQDLQSIRAIQDDLERQAFRATAGSGGNSMTQERQELARRMGRSALQGLPMVGKFAELLEAAGQKRLNDRLAYLLANPKEARRVLSTLNDADKATVNKALLQLSARTGASIPALTE